MTLPPGAMARVARQMYGKEEAARREAEGADPELTYLAELLGEEVYRWLRSRLGHPDAEPVKSRMVVRRQFSLSLTRGMLDLAVRRLPATLDVVERERWAEEMAADAAAIPGRVRRLIFSFGLLRKGAPAIPVGAADASRSADS